MPVDCIGILGCLPGFAVPRSTRLLLVRYGVKPIITCLSGVALSKAVNGKPAKPQNLHCAQRLPHKLILEWTLEDPAGEPLTSCEVYAPYGVWQETPILDEPKRVKGNVWRATIVGLAPSSLIEVRVRGLNAAGHGSWCDSKMFRASEKPDMPELLPVMSHSPEKFNLMWRLSDPEGAPVKTCQVRVYNETFKVWEKKALFDPGNEPHRVDRNGNLWKCTLSAVKCVHNQSLHVCIRGINAAGKSEWCEAHLEVPPMSIIVQGEDIRIDTKSQGAQQEPLPEPEAAIDSRSWVDL